MELFFIFYFIFYLAYEWEKLVDRIGRYITMY